MKIEKISDNQIRCTLTSEDLSERQLKLSEIAYGSEKARLLLKDMIQMAAKEYGFEGDDVPLVVEAIPTSSSSLVMIITKVENPEELDGRFSRFTPYGDREEGELEENPEIFGSNKLESLENDDAKFINNVLKELGTIKNDMEAGKDFDGSALKRIKRIRVDGVYRSFEFDSLPAASRFASAIIKEFRGRSRLYKDTKNHKYYLVLFMRGVESETFNRVCNMGCEFGNAVRSESLSYYNEFYKLVAGSNAVERLADVYEG